MDFIFFKFIYGKHGKNLLIRRDDVTLKYLRLQTRQLFRIPKDQKFALSIEFLKDNDSSVSPTNRHYYCMHPNERPDKLLTTDKQLSQIRNSRRNKYKDTKILVNIYTDSESI